MSQVEPCNDSFVNKLNNMIPNPRITYKYVDEYGKNKGLQKPDYKLLMANPDVDNSVIGLLNDDCNNINSVVLKYKELAKKYRFSMHFKIPEDMNQDRNNIVKSQIRQIMLYRQIKNELEQEMSQFGYNDYEIADILVSYLYSTNNKNKDLIWICYGDILYSNLEKRKRLYTKEIQCIDCGKWFEVKLIDNQTCRCMSCQKEFRKKYKAEKERERRNRLRGQHPNLSNLP